MARQDCHSRENARKKMWSERNSQPDGKNTRQAGEVKFMSLEAAHRLIETG